MKVNTHCARGDKARGKKRSRMGSPFFVDSLFFPLSNKNDLGGFCLVPVSQSKVDRRARY